MLVNKSSKKLHEDIKINSNNSTTARTARFSKKSLGFDVGEIKKMSEK